MSNGSALLNSTPKPLEQQWGEQLLRQIDTTFWMPGQKLYREETNADKPAFIWSASVELSALAAAARVAPDVYTERLKSYADALHVYWTERGGRAGFAAEPAPVQADRYYDDNAWMALALLDTYAAVRDPQYLNWAEETLRFVLSGEDQQLGGGIYWREPDRPSKNACSTAPAIVAALRLYELNSNAQYVSAAQRLYEWTNAHLQDHDGLFFDHVRMDSQVDPTKWSYNSALMVESNVEFYKLTGDAKYLAEAQRIARAAQARWVHTETGAVSDDAPFAHLLAEAFLSLYAQDGEAHWKQLAFGAIHFTQAQANRANGHYGRRWDGLTTKPESADRLIDWASAARAYWVAARLD